MQGQRLRQTTPDYIFNRSQRLVIKPGTERNDKRNEMEKSVKRVDSGAVRSRLQRLGGLQADKQDTECTLAGLNPMLRVSGLHPILRVSGLHPMLRQRDPAARLIV